MTALGLLGVILVILKVLGQITMPWWQVLMPFYVPIIAWIVFLIVGVWVAASSEPSRYRRYR